MPDNLNPLMPDNPAEEYHDLAQQLENDIIASFRPALKRACQGDPDTAYDAAMSMLPRLRGQLDYALYQRIGRDSLAASAADHASELTATRIRSICDERRSIARQRDELYDGPVDGAGQPLSVAALRRRLDEANTRLRSHRQKRAEAYGRSLIYFIGICLLLGFDYALITSAFYLYLPGEELTTWLQACGAGAGCLFFLSLFTHYGLCPLLLPAAYDQGEGVPTQRVTLSSILCTAGAIALSWGLTRIRGEWVEDSSAEVQTAIKWILTAAMPAMTMFSQILFHRVKAILKEVHDYA